MLEIYLLNHKTNTMKSMILKLKNLITEKMSKNLFAAITVAMFILQSCSNKTEIAPLPVLLDTKTATSTAIQEESEIKCGTEVPGQKVKIIQTTPQTPPIFVPTVR